MVVVSRLVVAVVAVVDLEGVVALLDQHLHLHQREVLLEVLHQVLSVEVQEYMDHLVVEVYQHHIQSHQEHLQEDKLVVEQEVMFIPMEDMVVDTLQDMEEEVPLVDQSVVLASRSSVSRYVATYAASFNSVLILLFTFSSLANWVWWFRICWILWQSRAK